MSDSEGSIIPESVPAIGTDQLKFISVKDFRDGGYLSEVNRRVLHPLGLALSVDIAEDGTETFGPIWDCRDDPEGIVYDGVLTEKMTENAKRIERQIEARREARVAALGFFVQDPGQKPDPAA